MKPCVLLVIIFCVNQLYDNILHCSDGMERTGTFITIHSQVERLKTEGVVDFFQTIKSARLQRTGFVHNTVSYKYTVCLHI